MRTMGRWTLSGILAVAAVGALSLAAAAQSRQFTFAYDQPKGSGYDAGADIFDKKLKELSNGALSSNKYPGAQLGTEAHHAEGSDRRHRFCLPVDCQCFDGTAGIRRVLDSLHLPRREPRDQSAR